MKKILLVFAMVFAVAAVSAQSAEWGVKAGLNFARETDGSNSTNARVGFNAGVFVEIPLADNWGLQPELLYSMQGGKSTLNGETTTDKFDYLNIPVIVKAYVYDRRLSIDFGPQIGLLLSAKTVTDGHSMDLKDAFDNKYDIAIALGASYKFGMHDNFDVGIRFNMGLVKYMNNFDNRNSVMQINAGYRF